MVQIVQGKRKQSFGDQITQGFGNLLNSGAESAQRDLSKGKMDELGNEIGVKNLGSYSPKIQEEIVSSHFQSKRQAEKYGFEENLQKGKPPNAKAIADQEEQNRITETGQKAFNGLSTLLKKGNVGFGSGAISKLPFAYDTQRDVGEFSSLLGGLESMLVDMVSRGTLSNTRFAYIRDNLLPTTDDRQETIKGKLMGLADILNLDPSELTGESPVSEEPSLSQQKTNKKPPLTSFMK